MTIQKYAKEEIASHQIETALRLFFEKGDLFSVITLAGAAEEILGQLLALQGATPGHRFSFTSVLKILRPGKQREARRNGGSGDEADAFVHMDLEREALFLLGRAIDDYHALSGTLSARMLKFQNEVRAKTP
jgi:hypothetical protein